MKRIAFVVLALAVTVAGAVDGAPKPGFVTVIGSAAPGCSHADRGAPAPIQGLALKHSGALLGFCNVSEDGALGPLLASGRDIAVYVYINQAEVEYYYGKGVRLFIFGNEPDGDWGTYGSILQQAYPMFQAGAPGSTVIGGNCFSLPPYDGLYQYHAFKDNCDMVGFHCYSDDPATGVSIGSIVSLHNIMDNWGDGSKKIFVGEGWGPKRELRSMPRVSPYVTPSTAEIEAMRDFVVNGWRLRPKLGGYRALLHAERQLGLRLLSLLQRRADRSIRQSER